MPRYIDISDLHIPEGIFQGVNVPKLLAWLESLPAANVEEVKHGEWIAHGADYECSKCGKYDSYGLDPYCCNCGAKMDGEENEDAEIC